MPYQELRAKEDGTGSAEMRARVEKARAIQHSRRCYNARIPVKQLRKLCTLDDAGERTLEMAVRRMGLSARAHDRILRVARTIADLDSSERISAKHLAEAVQYRSLDRNYWQYVTTLRNSLVRSAKWFRNRASRKSMAFRPNTIR